MKKNKETVRVLCDECLKQVDAPIETMSEIVSIRGIDVTVQNEYPICPLCGSRIAANDFMDKNLAALYEQYRITKDIPNPDEIRALRKQYNLSQRQLSAILGIGLASLQRYEKGSLPSETHAELLRNARSPHYLKQRLKDKPKGLSAKDLQAIASALDAHTSQQETYHYYVIALLDAMPIQSSIHTGNRDFDSSRLRETLVVLASSVHNLYKTKLNKVLFFLDFSTYRDTGSGFTGLQYAHANFGPVPDQYEVWMPAFVDGVALDYEECEQGGQIICALRAPDLSIFSAEDLTRLKTIADFINTFPTVKELSDASHEEDAWKNTVSGEIISYEWAKTLTHI